MSYRILTMMISLALFATALTSCYRAATEDDFCTIPVTNNCGITRHQDRFQPGVSY